MVHTMYVFLCIFINLYKISFPKKKVSINTSTLENPGITKGLIKSSTKKAVTVWSIFEEKNLFKWKKWKKKKKKKNISEKLKKRAKRFIMQIKYQNQ